MIENTANRDSIVNLMGVLSEGQSGYIEGMEAAGQAQVVASTQLPAEADWGLFESAGFVRGEPVSGDPLFVNATLPNGWSKRASEHSMYTEIVDERGVKRVNIFYKAAFYGRRADMYFVNVGGGIAREAIYGDEPAVTLPSFWSALTTDEKADARASAISYTEDADRLPKIYGDRLPRALALLELIDGEARP